MPGPVNIDSRVKGWLDGLVAEAKAVAPDTSLNANYTKKSPGFLSTASQNWQSLHSADKVSIGIGLVCASLSGLGAIGSASRSITKDETGKAHVQWSHVGVALLQGALAVGCTCLAVQAVRLGNSH